MSRDKTEIYAELIDEVRRSQTATARFDSAVAARIGINQTDLSCLDVLSRTGPLTAGQLAAQTGLSSGAMTTAIDRLEQRGFVRRQRDSQDRRVVMIELTEQTLALDRFYDEHEALAAKLYRQLTAEQLEAVLTFTRAGRELNERRAAELEAELKGTRLGGARPQAGAGEPDDSYPG